MKKSVLKTLPLIVASTVVLGLGSCTKTGPVAATGGLIEVDASINAPMSTQNNSKAIISGTSWVDGATFSAWVVPYKDVAGSTAGELRTQDNYEDNVVYTYSSATGAFTADRQTYYPTNDSKIDIYAISPSTSATSISSIAAYPFTIDTDQSTSDALITKNDLMTGIGSGTAAVNSGKATLAFTHRLSKVLVVFSVPNSYQGNTITSVSSVEVIGINPSTKINITDLTQAAPAPTGAAVDVLARQVVVPDAGVVPQVDTYTYEAIVTPASSVSATKSIVRIKLNVENIGVVTFDCIASSAHTYEAQKQTQINVSIGDAQEIVVDNTNVKINDWGTPTTVNGSTTKMSKMIFDIERIDLCADADKVNKAILTIEGVAAIEAKVSFAANGGDATKGQYTLQYDHGSNFGGKLEAVTLMAGSTTVGSEFSALDYQIKYDPTIDSYSTVIATITFTGATSSTIAKK